MRRHSRHALTVGTVLIVAIISVFGSATVRSHASFFPGRATAQPQSLEIPHIILESATIPLVISEFRFRGPFHERDEYVEIYNRSDGTFVVSTTDGSAGFALVAANGIARLVIPNGTSIPARGHFLGVSTGYRANQYPAGNGSTATGDVTFVDDIPDNSGVALFSSSIPRTSRLRTGLMLLAHLVRLNSIVRELGTPR